MADGAREAGRDVDACQIPALALWAQDGASVATVFGLGRGWISGNPGARDGDRAWTCNDRADWPGGTVMAVGTVMIGG